MNMIVTVNVIENGSKQGPNCRTGTGDTNAAKLAWREVPAVFFYVLICLQLGKEETAYMLRTAT